MTETADFERRKKPHLMGNMTDALKLQGEAGDRL
jgi:hypothetical protein